jgi:hypothetical protein
VMVICTPYEIWAGAQTWWKSIARRKLGGSTSIQSPSHKALLSRLTSCRPCTPPPAASSRPSSPHRT